MIRALNIIKKILDLSNCGLNIEKSLLKAYCVFLKFCIRITSYLNI